MVWFTFTFLLGLPKSSGVGEKSKKKAEKLQVDKNYVELEVSKPSFTCHIEYVLFPNDPPKRIDVACWDEVAKIYFENATSAFRPKVSQKLRWIHFRVNHNMTLSTSDVPEFYNHEVKISVSLGNKKFGDQAKSDNTKKFYAPNFIDGQEQYIREQYFQPVSETLDDLSTVSYIKEHLTIHQQLYVSLDTTIETSENADLLLRAIMNLTQEYHDVNYIRMPSSPPARPPPIRNILEPVPVQTPEELKKKEKDRTVETKKKEPLSDTIDFSVAGEEFFSGRKLFQNFVKYNSNDLPFIVNIIRVRNMLTRSQAEYYNPLTIKLNHCSHIPAENLKENGVTTIKFRYLIFNEFLVETNSTPISESIRLNFSRTFLTNCADSNYLIHFLQTGGLKIEILGNLAIEKITQPSTIFNEQELRKSHRYHETAYETLNDENFILLGSTFVDISSLLLQPHRVLLKCNMQIPPVAATLTQEKNAEKREFITVYELCTYQGKKINLELSSLLSPAFPILTVSVKICYPLTRLYQSVLMNPNLLNRLFAVIYDREIAMSIIQIIQNESRQLLEPVNYCKNSLNIKRPLTKKHMGTLCGSESTASAKQMSGFLVDAGSKILVFVEGSLFGSIHQVWTVLSFIKPSQGHVLFDSSLVFTERLYKNFLKYGGFYKVNLQNDVNLIPIKHKRCSEISTPQLAWRAITSLNMLIHCKSIKTAIQNNLFPDSDSLNCLALEFGIPIQMWDKTN